MRGYGKQTQGPSWIFAVVIFAALLVFVQLFRNNMPAARPLEQQFAAKAPEPGAGQVELPALPSSVSDLARTAAARIDAGSTGQALTPVAEGGELRVEITGMRSAEGGLQVKGMATNIGQRPLPVSLAAFRFTDGTGTVYAPQNDASTTLAPGQRAPLDLTLPIQDPRQLTLDVQPEGGQVLRMVLIQTPQ